jgi:hypothetical protein
MNLFTGIAKCVSLNFFVFNFFFLGQEEILDCYLFIDNNLVGRCLSPKGESGVCQ